MWGRTRQSLKRGIWKQKRLSQERNVKEIDISFFGCSDLSLPQFSVRILIVYSHFHVDVSLPLGTQPATLRGVRRISSWCPWPSSAIWKDRTFLSRSMLLQGKPGEGGMRKVPFSNLNTTVKAFLHAHEVCHTPFLPPAWNPLVEESGWKFSDCLHQIAC